MNEAYVNLKAEMARHGIKQIELANLLNVREATISEKINGKYAFDIDEALKIKNEFFQNISIEYLFSKGVQVVA